MAEVIMPKMGDAMEEGTLLAWKKQDGDTVKSGDIIAEIETDKSNVEIEAEDSGVLHIQAQPGAVVPVGNAIATIGDVKAAPTQQKAAAAPAPPSSPPAAAPSRPAPKAAPQPASANNGRERVKASPLARSPPV